MTLIKDAEGKDVTATELEPSLSATGLASQSAGAITDYYGLAAARGYANDAASSTPSVSVRTPGSWKRHAGRRKAGRRDPRAGPGATVVAGSAREDVTIFVPGYSKDDAGKESPLGTVQQSWVRQDAADAVSGSLTGTDITLLFLTLLAPRS